MSLLSRYVVPCITEGVGVVSDYRYDQPTVCPNNPAHTINSAGIYIYDSITPNVVTIYQDSDVTTGGFYRADYFNVDIPGGTGAITNYDVSYPYNVSIYSGTFITADENIGDLYDIVGMPDTNVGSPTSIVNIGVTGLNLGTGPALLSLNPGFNISITDGVNTDVLGIITAVDKINGDINFTIPTVHSFSISSSVLIDIPRVLNGKFVRASNTELGFSRVGSSGLPAGGKIRFKYTNNNGVPKTFNFFLELEY